MDVFDPPFIVFFGLWDVTVVPCSFPVDRIPEAKPLVTE
jgi:hypothetical protein